MIDVCEAEFSLFLGPVLFEEIFLTCIVNNGRMDHFSPFQRLDYVLLILL